MRDWDWDYGASEDPEYRRAVVVKHLARLQPPPKEPEPHDYPRKPEHLTFPHDFVRLKDSGQIITVSLAKKLGCKFEAGDPDGDRDLS